MLCHCHVRFRGVSRSSPRVERHATSQNIRWDVITLSSQDSLGASKMTDQGNTNRNLHLFIGEHPVDASEIPRPQPPFGWC